MLFAAVVIINITVALMKLVVGGMVFKLFPAVAIYTTVFKITSIGISLCLLLSRPKATLLPCRVLIQMGAASIILPVVSILALVPHMASHFVVEWAPDCLEMEHVEI